MKITHSVNESSLSCISKSNFRLGAGAFPTPDPVRTRPYKAHGGQRIIHEHPLVSTRCQAIASVRFTSVCLLAMLLREQSHADCGAFSRCQRKRHPFQSLLKRRAVFWLLDAKEPGMRTLSAIQW